MWQTLIIVPKIQKVILVELFTNKFYKIHKLIKLHISVISHCNISSHILIFTRWVSYSDPKILNIKEKVLEALEREDRNKNYLEERVFQFPL